MSEKSELTIERRDGFAVIYPKSYINNEISQEIARAAETLIAENYKILLMNLAETKTINTPGFGNLIQVIVRMDNIKGRVIFCSLTRNLNKMFNIFGIAENAQIFPNEAAAIAGLK